MTINLLYDDELLLLGRLQPICWSPEKAPHMVIFGSTGSGKTYCTKLILGKICKYVPNVELFLLDYKGDDDFSFLKNRQHFYRFSECKEGLESFYNKFLQRQSGEDKNRHMLILFFDEWASFLNSLDKREIEEEKKKLATLLMLGRSFRVHVIISQQRCDASYFSTARDNFNIVIGLGNLSEESKQMFFHEFKDQMKSNRTQGTGYMLTNGTNFTAVRVPTITDFNKLHNLIKTKTQP